MDIKTDYFKLIKDPDKTREYTKLAKKTIITDLYDNNIHGRDRAVNFEFYEDEKSFNQVGHFIPGCFYIFRHEGELLRMTNSREFHDIVPIFLALRTDTEKKTGERFTFGINFNILTIPIRAAILQELYNMDKIFFDKVIVDRFRGKHIFSNVILKSFAADGGKAFLEYICRKYKIKKESLAFRKYYFENISKVRLIDYWQWKYLPFIDVSEGMRGATLRELQKESIN